MATLTEHEVNYDNGNKKIVYLQAGPREGPLMIFVHGWPAIGKTWIHQLNSFSSLGFRVVAPDMPGCGKSTSNHKIEDYAQEEIEKGLLAVLKHTGREDAIWIGHDWGSGCVWSFAAHHPEKCRAVCNISVPYRVLELGLEELLKYVNRNMYPEDKYPYGQWEYQAFYEQSFDKATAWFDNNIPAFFRAIFSRRENTGYGQPAFTATTIRDGGWFGGATELPPAESFPLDKLIVDRELLDELVAAFKKTGLYGADAYYMNHKRNRAYNLDSKVVPNDAVLEMPVLYIEGLFDTVCDTANSRMSEPQRKLCKNLTEVSIKSGHWVQLEQPEETNAVLARWLCEEVKSSWPGYWKNAFVKHSKL